MAAGQGAALSVGMRPPLQCSWLSAALSAAPGAGPACAWRARLQTCTGLPAPGVACTGALAQGSACRRSRLPGRGQPWAAPCTGRQRAHPAVVLCRAARTAARATAALPNTWACRAPAHALRLLQHGATPSLPPTSPAKGLAQGPEGSFIWAEAGASPAEQSRAGSCRLLPPSACIAHATHALKPGPGTWQSQGRAKPPALGWWVWPGCSGEARLTGASDAPALGWALTVPFLCAPAEPP